jgi:ribonuclease P protein component
MMATLSKEQKLRKSGQFRHVYTGGRRLSGPRLTIFYQANNLRHNRLGLAVRKKRFKLSTRRHYIQRRLREAYRHHQMLFLPGYDIVVSAHRLEESPSAYNQIRDELLSLARKAGLLKENAH